MNESEVYWAIQRAAGKALADGRALGRMRIVALNWRDRLVEDVYRDPDGRLHRAYRVEPLA